MSINSLDLSILPLLSVLERLDLLCRTDREVALRAAARYISLLLHHHVCMFPYPTATLREVQFQPLTFAGFWDAAAHPYFSYDRGIAARRLTQVPRYERVGA